MPHRCPVGLVPLLLPSPDRCTHVSTVVNRSLPLNNIAGRPPLIETPRLQSAQAIRRFRFGPMIGCGWGALYDYVHTQSFGLIFANVRAVIGHLCWSLSRDSGWYKPAVVRTA